MKTYNLMVNLNEGKKFVQSDWRTIGTVSAKSKEDAENKVKREYRGEDCGVVYTIDLNSYLGMKVKAFKNEE